MHTIETATRSSWRKSIERALDAVVRGELTPKEFLRISRPSPDPRDRSPETMLRRRMEGWIPPKEVERRKAERERRRKEEMDRRISELRDKKVWRLCGGNPQRCTDEFYTLSELFEWAAVARAYFGCLEPRIWAQTDDMFAVPLDFQLCDGPRFIDFEGAVADLRRCAALYFTGSES